MKKIILKIVDLSTISDPSDFFGCYRDWIGHFSYKFTGGNLYHIDSDFGDGGWSISYALAGFSKLDNHLAKNEFYLNNIKLKYSDLKNIACYVGNKSNERLNAEKSILWPFRKNKYIISNEISRGLIKNSLKYSVNKICEIFSLDDYNHPNGRANRLLEHVSIQRYRASMAIGFSQGKKIFVFPQISNFITKILDGLMKKAIVFLKKQGCIIIIPTKYISGIKDTVDKTIKYNELRPSSNSGLPASGHSPLRPN